MLKWYEALILLGYLAFTALIAWQLVQRVARSKDLEYSFDGPYFLRWSVGSAVMSQLGFVSLVCALFWTRQSLAVGITTLIGLPGWFAVCAGMQWGFFRRYSKLSNLIKRIEKMSPLERSELLESLPPEVFLQLPGDYRIVSWEEHRRP
ncbi:MAG TPA: hypothetical protein VH186_33205 [Chloroflexia bacterium]|nr:hypothetical protein [Chloroflexia bacterium]